MIPKAARQLLSASRISAAWDEIAAALNRDLPDEEVTLLPVMNGGIFPACELARRLDRRIRFDYVHATRYRGGTRGGEIEWLHWPKLSQTPETVILVDDIFDEGYTLKAIHDRIAADYRVVTAVLLRKQHDRGLARDWVDYHGIDIPDVYVFGCGMDYHENFRELPEVWYMPESS
ncbi:MAG: phosphoribosyltransferase [Wenzhouxiangellaceae bacterium]